MEEQFYLFIPVLAKRGGARMLGIAAGVLFVLCPVALAVLVYWHALDYAVWSNSFVQFSSFATGLALAVWLHLRPQRRASRGLQVLIGAGGVALLAGASLTNMVPGPATNWPVLSAGYAAVSVGAAVCIYAFVVRPWSPPRVLVYFGKVSYGLYVFHPWAVGIAKIVTAGVLPGAAVGSMGYSISIIGFSFVTALMMASGSYYILESPFLRLKDRFAVVRSRPVN